MFVNSAFYTVAMILLGQALVVPMMAYALSRFNFKGREAIFFTDSDVDAAAVPGDDGAECADACASSGF